MAETPATEPNEAAERLFRDLPNRYDRLSYLLSFGQDRRWRREVVHRVSQRAAGPLVLDVATGPAGVALALRSATRSHVVGLDLTASMLERARSNIEGRGERDVHLVQGRAEELPFADNTFDAVTFSYLLRYVENPDDTLAELARVLRPGGMLASLEFHVPPNPWWRAWWWLYTRAVLPAAGMISGGAEWRRVGHFLGPSISAHCRRYPVAWTVTAWHRAGVRDVDARLMSLGGGLVMSGIKVASE